MCFTYLCKNFLLPYEYVEAGVFIFLICFYVPSTENDVLVIHRLPGGAVEKNPPACAGDARDEGSMQWPPRRRKR